VYIVDAHVGDIWGTNPDTGAPLVLTKQMFSGANVYGFDNSLFWSSGTAADHKYRLAIVPKKNPKDNNNWYPSFDISRVHRDIVLASKGSKGLEYGVQLATLETEKFVKQKTYEGIRDTIGLVNKTSSGMKDIINVGNQFLEGARQAGTGIFQGSANVSKDILEGARQATIAIMDAGGQAVTATLESIHFDINEIRYHESLSKLKDGVLGDVRIIGDFEGNKFDVSFKIDVKQGMDQLASALKPAIEKLGNDIKKKIFDPITDAFTKNGLHVQSVLALPKPVAPAIAQLAQQQADQATQAFDQLKKQTADITASEPVQIQEKK